MSMTRLILALAAVAALGGCFKLDKTPPKDLPPYVQLYPGSTQVMHMDMGPLTVDGATTPDSVDTVLAFYRTHAADNGLTETTPPQTTSLDPSQKQLAFEGPGELLAVVAKPEGAAGTLVTLSWSTPKKAAS
jgi:hypothetical protein